MVCPAPVRGAIGWDWSWAGVTAFVSDFSAVTSRGVRVLSANGNVKCDSADQAMAAARPDHHAGELEQTQGLAKNLIDCFGGLSARAKPRDRTPRWPCWYTRPPPVFPPPGAAATALKK